MFRKITLSDKKDFIGMSREFYASDAVLYGIPDSYHEKTFRELMRSEDYLKCYIFDIDGKCAGYALLNIQFSHETGGKLVWLEELYVRKEYQNHGIGSSFLHFMENTEQANRYRLETEPENERAVELYKRNGYKKLKYHQYYKDMI